MKTSHSTTLAILVIFTLVTFFANTGALPTDIMEERNVVTAREMVSDGNWLVPTMNGQLRLEKPPLPTWVAGAIEAVCPNNLGAQRLAAGAMGCLWTWFLFLTARDIDQRVRELSRMMAYGVNLALQPQLTVEDITGLLG